MFIEFVIINPELFKGKILLLPLWETKKQEKFGNSENWLESKQIDSFILSKMFMVLGSVWGFGAITVN